MGHRGRLAAVCAVAVLLGGCGGGNDAELTGSSDEAAACKAAMVAVFDKIVDAMDPDKDMDASMDALAEFQDAKPPEECTRIGDDEVEKIGKEVVPEYEAKIKAKGEEFLKKGEETFDKSGLELLDPKVDLPSLDDLPKP